MRGPYHRGERRSPYDASDLKALFGSEALQGLTGAKPLRLGLFDYVRGVPKDGRLFPELRPGPHGKLTGAFSKWWARFADTLGVRDPRKTFHSLRHCFKDACRAAEVSEEIHDAMTGHVSGAVGRCYGSGVPLKVLAEAVEKVSHPGVRRSQGRAGHDPGCKQGTPRAP